MQADKLAIQSQGCVSVYEMGDLRIWRKDGSVWVSWDLSPADFFAVANEIYTQAKAVSRITVTLSEEDSADEHPPANK